MRVGFYTYRIDDRPTGLANYARKLTYALRDSKADVEIVLLNPHPGSELDWYRDLPTYPLHAPRGLRGWRSVSAAPLSLVRAVRDLKLDIVHAPANIAPFVGFRGDARWVATVHDVAPVVLPAEHRVRSRMGYALAIPTLRWTADAVLTVSEASKRDLVGRAHLSPESVHVTPNGVDVPEDGQLEAWRTASLESMGVRPGERYVLAVGDVRPRRNLVRILHAFRAVLGAYPDLRMILVGQAMHRSSEVRSATVGMERAVREVGYVSDEVLHELYAGAQVLVTPSLYEGFGLPALEAMAHGIPVIAAPRGGLPEVVGDAGLMVDPYDIDAIARAIKTVITDADLRGRLGAMGRARAATFTWAATASETVKVYSRLLS